MDEFADIRPYRDSEVREVLDRLLVDDELLNAVAALRMPKASRWFPKLLRPLISAILRRQFKRVVSVADFQQLMKDPASLASKMTGPTSSSILPRRLAGMR